MTQCALSSERAASVDTVSSTPDECMLVAQSGSSPPIATAQNGEQQQQSCEDSEIAHARGATKPLLSRKRSSSTSNSTKWTNAMAETASHATAITPMASFKLATSPTSAESPLSPRSPPRAPTPVWLDDIQYVNDAVIPIATRLGHEILEYCDYTQRVIAKQQAAMEDAIWNISICVQSIWPEATVTCFGSFATGLWLPSSDVDVVVMNIPHTFSDSTPESRRFVSGIDELEQIAVQVRQQPWVKRIEVVASAKVPVAKLVLAEGDLRVDISIENVHTRLGIEASALVRDYITVIPVLHPLIMVLKQLLREKGLNNAFTGGLSSYCIALMAFYLVERQGATSYAGTDVGQLLIDFLEFYGTIFSYATTGISLKAEAFGEYFLDPTLTMGANGVPLLMPQLVIDDPVYEDGQHNAAAGAFAIARVIAAFENAFYAVTFHRPSRFAPTPLSQLLHWTGHGADGVALDESSA
ncbi:hypothetical protein PINS_up006409 [Pythium insidiosum]|nr:hypothetical protein PINS_up006409 [Pythium insidiosum]